MGLESGNAPLRVAVTGAASGIGRATAHRFAALGSRVALIDLNELALDAVRQELPGEDHLALPCDVSVPKQIRAAFALIADRFGGLDTLINNAGINPTAASTAEIDEDFYDRVMDVNVKGIFFCAQSAIEMLAAAERGTIVNLGSVSGMIGWGGTSVYTASKGAVIALTKFQAIEYAPLGVRVNAVCPGSIRTPMVEQNLAQLPDPDKAWASAAALHPIGRVGTPEEVADAILYLASSQSSFVTGTTLVIDGGLTAI
jgi:NAD(P)-dependent dehydrogenase (short-subunit alcohol dehydrogenase family)